VCPNTSDEHSCDERSLIDGTAVYVTGTFGLTVASVVINTITAPYMSMAKPAKSGYGNMGKASHNHAPAASVASLVAGDDEPDHAQP
jgi:hypothetical protein